MLRKSIVVLCLLVLAILAAPVSAQLNPDQQKKVESAFKEAVKALVEGPAEVPLLDQANINLPERYSFIPQPQAGKLMQSMGNPPNPDLVGLIVPQRETEEWIISIVYEKSGYIKDGDAKNWNQEELLQSVKDGTAEANKERQKQGYPEMEIIGWAEMPKYNPDKHQLVYSISGRNKGAAAKGSANTVNYNTYVLGREGYLNIKLITTLNLVDKEKARVVEILEATRFVAGKRYEDFNSSTDKVAEYGLAALVAGVTAKKLGLIGIIAKFGKVIVVAVAAFGAGIYKLLGRKKKNETPPPPES